MVGMRPIVEMQFADFIMPALNQIISEAAKLGREVTGLLLRDESQPTMAQNLGISADHAPVFADISVSANLEAYRGLLADLR